MGKEILTKRQIEFLEVVKSSADLTNIFYLSGGTALAAFHLNHRESEDLDFFSEQEVDPLAIEVFLKSHKEQLDFERFEIQRSFNRNLYFIHFEDGVLKTEFTYFPFPPLEDGTYDGKLRIDSMRDIAVNKVFTVSQQLRARDFVDLFFILKKEEWKIGELVRDARVKFDTSVDPVQLGSQFVQVSELKDFPRMRIALDREEFHSFFLKEAISLKAQILA